MATTTSVSLLLRPRRLPLLVCHYHHDHCGGKGSCEGDGKIKPWTKIADQKLKVEQKLASIAGMCVLYAVYDCAVCAVAMCVVRCVQRAMCSAVCAVCAAVCAVCI